MAALEIFVLILGESPASKKMFPVVAPASMTVGRWKHSVYAERKNRVLKGYDAADLTLWKLNDPVSATEVEKWPLGQDLSSIAKEMLPGDEVSDYFSVPPPRKSLHVIAALPSLSSAGERRGWPEGDRDDEMELSSHQRVHPSLPSAGEKHRRLPDEDDQELASRAKKLRGDESQTRRSPPLAQIHEGINRRSSTVDALYHDRALALHNAIKTLETDLDLSNPVTFVMLPFPSLIPASVQRFQATAIEGVEYFRYMGRSKFTELEECTRSYNFVNEKLDIYLYGSSGSGKSHILAALVCQLIREGKRVVYIPDCRDLLKSPYQTVRLALYCAFYDDPASLQTIKSARDVEGLVEFCITIPDKYLVVDQLNALEVDPNHENLMDAKKCLGNMSFPHRYIYSAFANEQSNREVDLKQASIKVISLLGGMDEEETKQWFNHHSNDLPTLSNDDRQRVEYLTGRIPLLLRSLFEFKDKPFDEHTFLGCSELSKVNKDVTKYFREKLKEPQVEQTQYFEIMEACLQGARISTDLKQYDLRYFYVDNQRGCYTCGVVFESMMLLFREHRFQQFRYTKWYTALLETTNPAVRGFIAEQLCLNHISAEGLPAVSGSLTKMDVAPFHDMPEWQRQINNHFTLCLYTPIDFNFANIDAIILELTFTSKKAHLYPIQITLSRDHKNSEDTFYAEKWRSWVESMEVEGFTVDSTFVWIDKKQPSAQLKESITVSTRQGVKFVQPEHRSVHVAINQVDKQLAQALSL